MSDTLFKRWYVIRLRCLYETRSKIRCLMHRLCRLHENTIGFFTIRSSEDLSEIYGKEQNKFNQKLPPISIDPRVSRLLTVLAWYVFGRRFLKWALFHAPLHILDWQLNIDLAQLVEYWHDHLEVLGSIPTKGNFWRKLVSWKTRIFMKFFKL